MKTSFVRFAARHVPLLAGIVATACLSGPSGTEVTVWEADLVAETAYPGFSGSVAAVSGSNGTVVSILIEGAQPGAVHAWRIQLGSCSDPRQQLGPSADYPELEAGLQGSASVETSLGPRLNSEETYHAEVLTAPGEKARVACGNLSRD